jgi:Dna[CI] antecedent, DciA
MLPIQQFSSGVLAEIIRRQPPSKERTAFAWQIAVGPAVARTTTADLVNGVLNVRTRDAHWEREVSRAAATILARMQHLLGAQAVTALTVANDR